MMIPQKGHYVKVMFRNGAQAEGYVEAWSDKQSILKSAETGSLFLIQKTDEDVMAIKIEASEPKTVSVLERQLVEMQDQFEETYQQPSAEDLRLKNLAQLKVAMIEQERKLAAAKLKDHTFSGMRKNTYEHGLFQKQSSK